jgi:cytochrome c peroxidase
MGSRQIKSAVVLLLVAATLAVYSFSGARQTDYASLYTQHIQQLQQQEQALLAVITVADLSNPADVARIDAAIAQARNKMKAADIWLRYLEPIAYKHINGPLPVEWETEVFEKFEKPYRRDGAGFTLAWQHLHEAAPHRDTLLQLVRSAIEATAIYTHDSITAQQDTYHNFYLCNRLFLLNLAAIYTTGFDCPDERRIIPELRHMLSAVAWNKLFD